MLRYGITIFLSALLLFQVQPLIARNILPWFGGTAAVWTGCMLFFQTGLLLGYGYAYVVQRWLSPRNGWYVHMVFLTLAAFFAMPIPSESLQPSGTENVTVGVWSILLKTIAIPFIALSATSPLIQAWQAETHSHRSPYPLYALSNVGSLLALISYPFVIEPWLSAGEQGQVWRLVFWMFVVFCFASGWQVSKISDRQQQAQGTDGTLDSTPVWQLLVWLALAMTGSVVLLATTNLLCQEIAAVPLLWIAPLTVYLLSFVICFDYPNLYQRWFFIPFLAISAVIAVFVVLINVFAGVGLQIGAMLSVCFAATMTCHGELERLKPAPRELTKFYFILAFGGALGGFGVAVLAPKWFADFYEFYIGVLASLTIMMIACYYSYFAKRGGGERWKFQTIGSMIGLLLLIGAFAIVALSLYIVIDPNLRPNEIHRERNEYGLLAVEEKSGYRNFIHGHIEHGGEFVSGESKKYSSYYQPGSGVAVAIEVFREFQILNGRDEGLQVGVVGLGVGGMLAWSKANDQFTFFELDPAVERIARKYFRYLNQTPAKTEVIIGDGRIQLQRRGEAIRQKKATQAQMDAARFDLLFLDAFSSDAIPIHLMTAECFSIYLDNLAENGVLIAHITNRFVDLRPVVYHLANENQLSPILLETKHTSDTSATRWVLMTRNADVLSTLASHPNRVDWPRGMKTIRWSDDRSSLFDVITLSGKIDWTPVKETRQKNSKPNDVQQ